MDILEVALVAWAAAGATPKAEAPSESAVLPQTRLFDIRHLTEPIPDHPLEGPRSIGGLVVGSADQIGEPEEAGGFAFGAQTEEDLPVRPAAPAPPIAPEGLVDLIRRSIAPATWHDPANSIRADSFTLGVHQTPDVLETIEVLLSRLHAQRMRMYVDVAIVPLDAIDDAVRSGSPWFSSETFDRIIERAADQARRIGLMACDGQLVSGHVGARQTVIQEYVVNHTGVLAMLNPKVETIPFGTLAEVRPSWIPDTDWFIFGFHVIERSLPGKPGKQEAPFGEFESLPIAEKTLRGTTLVRAREAVLLGFLHGEDSAIGSFAAVARVRPPSLRDERPGSARLTRWFRELGGLTSIEAWTLKGARAAVHAFAALAGAGGKVPEDWAALAKRLGLVPDTTARTIGLAGEKSEAQAWITKTFVAGYDCWGGADTGWAPGHIPHPMIDWAGTGIDLRARMSLRDPSLATIRLTQRSVVTHFESTATLQAPWPTPMSRPRSLPVSPEGEPKEDRQTFREEESIAVPVKIDLPSQNLWGVRREIAVPLGVPVLLVARSDGPPDSPGRIMILRATSWRGADPGLVERESRTFDLDVVHSLTEDVWRPWIAPPGRLALHSPDEDEWLGRGRWNPESGETAVRAGIHAPEGASEVEGLAAALRELALRRFDIELAIIPPESLERAAGEEMEDQPWFASAIFDDAVRAAGDAAILWRASAADGEELLIEPVVRRTALVDHEYNMTGIGPTPLAVVSTLCEGLGGRLRVSSTPHPACPALEFEIASLDIDRPSLRRSASLGDIDLAQRGGVFLFSAIPVPAGKAVILGDLRLTEKGPPSRVVLARVRPSAPSPLPHPLVRPVDVRDLLREPPSRDRGVRRRSMDTEDLLVLVGSMLPPDLSDEPALRILRSSSHFFVTAAADPDLTARAGDAVERILRGLYEREAKTVDFRLRLATIAAGDLSRIMDPKADGAILLQNWREVAPLERESSIRLVGIAGWPLTLWAGRGRDYVADLVKVCGGRSFVQAADPIIGWAGSGIELRASVEPIAGLRDLAIWVKGVSAETTFGKTLDVRADETVVRTEPDGFRPVGMKVAIDLPEQEVQSWEHDVAVPGGRAALLAACPDPRDAGKVRILVVEARVHELRADD